MASIDAFLELADRNLEPNPLRRASQRRVLASGGLLSKASRRDRLFAVLIVVVLEMATVFLLRAAMRTLQDRPRSADAPLIISFIAAPRSDVVVPVPAAAVPHTVSARPVRTLREVSRVVRNDDALQAVVVSPSVAQPRTVPATQLPAIRLYQPDGELLLPSVPSAPPPRDLLAHRDVDYMIPGAARRDSPDFHVSPGLAPRDVVNKAGRIIGDLLASGSKGLPDSTGQPYPIADRGVRTSDRDSDPCEDLAIEKLDLDDPKRAEQADEQYAQFCEGH